MQKIILFLLASALSLTSMCQSLASLNFRHLYDPQNEVDLQLKLVNEQSQLAVYYKLQRNGPSNDRYSIEWLKYETFMQRSGTTVVSGDSLPANGKLSFPMPEKPWHLLAKVTNTVTKQVFHYILTMDPKYPVNGFLEGADGIVFRSYVYTGQEYAAWGTRAEKPLRFYYYRNEFPAASPIFLQKGESDRFLFADSVFSVGNGQKITFRSRGLYLVQQDTTAAEGFAFRVMNNAFPKHTRVQDIPEPLIYISAKEEHDELVAAGSDKAKVDKVILDITGERDRARNFMRSYFRRVELANLYFTTFKEGWKTDRGMVRLIFGLPDEISKTGQNEIWNYKSLKERFTFVKKGSVYDPNSMILNRSVKFTELWFSTVDLWRKSRFE